MRVTPQREALLAAVWRLRHATAESLQTALAASDASVNLSTVYRGLDALERLGLVRHAHLGTGGPTYHIAEEAPHIHLQCNECGRVIPMSASPAEAFVAAIVERTGFQADITHAAIYGRCAQCAVAPDPR
jgi:Fur family ferric uptake transcriptional regulator